MGARCEGRGNSKGLEGNELGREGQCERRKVNSEEKEGRSECKGVEGDKD
jgi:hypothetical protein